MSVNIDGDPFHGSSLDFFPEYLPLIPLLTTVFLTAAAHRKLLYQSEQVSNSVDLVEDGQAAPCSQDPEYEKNGGAIIAAPGAT